MAANTVPIYCKQANIGWHATPLKTANTAKDGTGTVVIFFTAGVDGSRVERIRSRAVGTNVATVLRIFINNGSDTTVAANNVLYAEKTIAATTGSETSALLLNEIPDVTIATPLDWSGFPLILPAGYRLTATIGTTIANGLMLTAVGGDY